VLIASLGEHPECYQCDNLATFVHTAGFCPELDTVTIAQRVFCEACVLRHGLRSDVQPIACAPPQPAAIDQPAETPDPGGGVYSAVYGSAAAVGSAIVYIPSSLYGAAGQALQVLGAGLRPAAPPHAPADTKDAQDWGGHTPPNSGPPSPRERAASDLSDDSSLGDADDVEAEGH
jgi:hypothetical protein